MAVVDEGSTLAENLFSQCVIDAVEVEILGIFIDGLAEHRKVPAWFVRGKAECERCGQAEGRDAAYYVKNAWCFFFITNYFIV